MKVLVISENYPYSYNEEVRADVFVVIYYNKCDVEPGC